MTLNSVQNAPKHRVIVQGMTGSEGMKHTARMLKCGTQIIGGVNPKKAGESISFEGVNVPVFGTVADALRVTAADVSVVFVPPRFAKDAVVEAILAGVSLIVVITEGIPVQDSVYFTALAKEKGVQVVGPNCPGLVEFSLAAGDEGVSDNLGIIPDGLCKPGPIGLVSKSGTLTYQVMKQLGNVGFKTAVGIGGDPRPGTGFIEMLERFEADPEIKIICLIGEIGGDAEERAAAFIKEHVSKPVFSYIAGVSAPKGKTMGHAGAIASKHSGTAGSKISALQEAGATVVVTLDELSGLIQS